MDTSSQRSIARANSSWSIPQLREQLEAALAGADTALGVGEIAATHVQHEIALVVATSGSTGRVKEVALSAQAISASARASNAFLEAGQGDTWSLLLPTDHIAGINVIARAINLRSSILTLNDRADFTAIVPTQLHRALNGNEDLFRHLRGAKAVLVGGGPLNPELRREAEAAGITIVTTYGMSESCGGCVYNGRPLDGVQVSSIDGRIAIRGDVLASGYLNSEAPFLTDGWFITSDLGEVTEGKVTITGRADDVIISGGEKISLSAITDFLNQKFPTEEIIALAFDSSEWGDALAIASTTEIDQAAIRALLIGEFGPHLSPKAFAVTSYIPKTTLGKPDRRKLIEEFGRLFS